MSDEPHASAPPSREPCPNGCGDDHGYGHCCAYNEQVRRSRESAPPSRERTHCPCGVPLKLDEVDLCCRCKADAVGRLLDASEELAGPEVAQKAKDFLAVPPSREGPELDRNGNPRIYPCSKCPTMRSAPEGGTTFAVCDECWDAVEGKAPSPRRPTMGDRLDLRVDEWLALRDRYDYSTRHLVRSLQSALRTAERRLEQYFQRPPAPPSEPTLAETVDILLNIAYALKAEYDVGDCEFGMQANDAPDSLNAAIVSLEDRAATLRDASAPTDALMEKLDARFAELKAEIRRAGTDGNDAAERLWVARADGFCDAVALVRAASAEPSGEPVRGVRPAVAAFALAMEARLQKHDATRGAEGWQGESDDYLFGRLMDEERELRRALEDGRHLPNWTAARDEAADVANFAMMLADNCGALEGMKRVVETLAAAPVSEPQREPRVEWSTPFGGESLPTVSEPQREEKNPPPGWDEDAGRFYD